MSDTDRLQRVTKPPAAIIICVQVIMVILPIAQVAVGALYQHDCPRQPYIPVYLMVVGVVALMLTLLSFLPRCERLGTLSHAWNSLVSLFCFCWFVAGNVWIYTIYEPSYNKTSIDLYCNQTLYLFAFWTTNLFYILLGFVFICSCCASCFK